MNVKRLALFTAAALACLQTQAQPAYELNWRDAFTPFADPLNTQPAQLHQPLRLQIPAELTEPSPAAKPTVPAASAADHNHANDKAAVDNTSSATAPDVLPANANNGRETTTAPTTVPASLSCATAEQAANLASPQQALVLLRNSQPASAKNKLELTDSADEALLLTLPQAVQLALCHNPQIRLSWSQIAQQAAALGQARSAWLPQLNASANRQRSQLRYPQSAFPADREYRSTYASPQTIGLRWRLWDFGARRAQDDAARLQLQAALASQNEAAYQTLVEVLHKYTDVQIATSQLRAQRAIRAVAQRNLETAQRRYKQGAASTHDTLQAMSDLARSNLEISRYQGEYNKALAQLIYVLGLPANTPVFLENASPLPQNKEQQTQTDMLMRKALDDWLEAMKQHHPAIKAAQAHWQAAQAHIKAAQSEGLPTVDVSYNYYRNGRPDQSISSMRSREKLVGITLNIPLFDGFANTYKVRSAQAVAEQKAVEYQNTQQQVLQEMVATHADAQSAWRNLNAANGLLLVSQEALASTQRLYQSGATDILQLNHALSNLKQAQQEQIQAQAQWLRARLKLWLAEAQTAPPPVMQ